MNNTVNFQHLENHIGAMKTRIEAYRRYYLNNSELSPEGKQAGFSRAISHRSNELHGYADRIRNQIEAARTASRLAVQAEREKLMPTATPETQLAAELAANRILGRTYENTSAAIAGILESEPASPGRTLALRELQTRTKFSEDTIEAHLKSVSPEYRQASRNANLVESGASNLEMRLNKVVEAMEDVNKSAVSRFEVGVQPFFDKGMPVEIEAPEPVQAVGELSAIDPAYNR